MFILDEVAKHKKKAAKHKLWVVEARSTRTSWCNLDQWGRYGRYTTQKRAEQAAAALRKSLAAIKWEFRVIERG